MTQVSAAARGRWRRGAFVGLLLSGVVSVGFFPQGASSAAHMVGSPEHAFPITLFQPDAQPYLRLAAIGDVGTAGTDEYETIAVMASVARPDPFDALVLLGDNVYPEGDPDRLEATVFQPFAPILDAGTNLLAVLGNHDVAHADRGALQMQALAMGGSWWSRTYADVLVVGLDSNQPDNPEQLGWLEETLASSPAAWRIAVMHHPPYSAGYHGSSVEVRDAFAPLFEQYEVQLVLSGHEHDYQRSIPINGVTYLVSGAGAKTRRTGTEEFTAYSAATFHFLDISVFADHIYVQAVDHDGRRFDDVAIAR